MSVVIAQEPAGLSSTDGLAVRCRGVTKTYDSGGTRTTALRGVDLDVATGELLMLVGPSGCGKTTLISVVAGILDPDTTGDGAGGSCHVFGHELSAMTDRARTAWRGRHIGFVFQAFNLLPTLTAAENVSVPLLINGVRRRDALERSEEALRRVGLGERARSLPKQLSGGQQQRVAIARALVHGPDLIVCDEPTSALDHDTGQRVMALLREVAVGPGRALVIVTHDERIFGYADRIAKMDDGVVVSAEVRVQSAE